MAFLTARVARQTRLSALKASRASSERFSGSVNGKSAIAGMPSFGRLLRSLDDEIDAATLDARHRRDGGTLAFAVADEHRPDQIACRQAMFGNETAATTRPCGCGACGPRESRRAPWLIDRRQECEMAGVNERTSAAFSMVDGTLVHGRTGNARRQRCRRYRRQTTPSAVPARRWAPAGMTTACRVSRKSS